MQSIEGLASGLDITSIVDKIMTYESQPVTLLEQEKEFKTQQVSAYKAVLAKILALKSNALLLKRESTYNKTQIDVSDTSILSASAGSSISAGMYSLQVLQLAHNHQIASQGFDDATTSAFGTGNIKLSVGDDSLTTIEISSGNNSLVGIKNAINAAKVGITASIINDGSSSNPYRLLLAANTTGAVNDINFEVNLTGGEVIDFNSGSFDNPELVSFSTAATSAVSLGSTAAFSGDANKIYTFTVGGTGTQTIGTDVITIDWTDGTNSGSIVVNEADAEYEVLLGGSTYDGLKLSFSAGSLVAGDTFQVSTFAPLLQDATDARVSIGGGSGAGSPIIVTSASNLLTDVIPGLNIDIKKTTEDGEYVTVKTAMDTGAIKQQISDFIEKYNDVMEFIDEQFTYNEDTTESGVLFADYPLQVMQSSMRFSTTSIVSGLVGKINSLAAIGIRSDADGKLRIASSSTLSKAIEQDLESVIELFINSGDSSNAFIEFVSSTLETEPGANYSVDITKAASKGYYQGSAISDPAVSVLTLDSSNNALKLKVDGLLSDNILLTERAYTSGDDLANEIQTRIDADDSIGNRGLKVEWVAQDESGYIKITCGDYGSAPIVELVTSISNTAYSTLGLVSGEFNVGDDVEGTINGEAATGNGQTLTGNEGNANTDGLKLKITYTSADIIAGAEGTISVIKGLATKIDETLENITKSIDGSIARRTSALEKQIEYLSDQITDYEERLAIKRENLYAEFLAMESALSQYQAEGDYLTQQLANIQTNWKSIYD